MKKQSGVSLIEVMVALLVLSVGMLGVAAMFLSTMQDTRSGLYRSKAAALAWDMVERIRANSSAGSSYVATESDTGSNSKNCAATKTTTSPDSCTNTELADYDIYEWKQALQDVENGLPSGNGTIARDTTVTPSSYTVIVSWQEPNEADESSVTVVTQL